MRIPLNLHQLEIFLLLADEKSFSRAADALGMTQPSISIQIKKLEKDLGAKLFDRLQRNACLTAEGHLVFDYAKKIFESIANLRSDLGDLKGIKVGNLTIGASRVPSSTTFPLAFALFRKQYPGTTIVVKTALSLQVEQWVLNNEVDFAIIGGDVTSKFIVKEPYYLEEFLLVLPPKHHLTKKATIYPTDVLSENFLLPPYGRVTKFIEEALQKKGVVITRSMTLGWREAIKASVAAGFGITIMPRSAVELEAKAGYLATKKIEDIDLRYPVNIIFHKDKHLSRLARTFLEFLRQLQSKSFPLVSKPLQYLHKSDNVNRTSDEVNGIRYLKPRTGLPARKVRARKRGKS